MDDNPVLVTVPMSNDQVDALDLLKAAIRRKHRVTIPRTQLIRSILGSVLASGLDLTEYGSAQKIERALLKRLAK